MLRLGVTAAAVAGLVGLSSLVGIGCMASLAVLLTPAVAQAQAGTAPSAAPGAQAPASRPAAGTAAARRPARAAGARPGTADAHGALRPRDAGAAAAPAMQVVVPDRPALPPVAGPAARATRPAPLAAGPVPLAAGPAAVAAMPAPVAAVPAPVVAGPAPPLSVHSVPGTGGEPLQALLARVLPQDAQVRVAQTLLQASQERRKQARSRLAPNLALSLNRGESREVDLFDSPIDRRLERADLALRWNLYNAGSDMAELAASTREVMAAEQDLRRAREESAERIAEAYLELLRVEDLIPRTRQRLAGVQRLVAMVQRQNVLGKASDSDAQQARASQLDAEIALDQLESDRLAARQKLARLTGVEVSGVQPLVLPEPPPGLVADTGQLAAARLRAEAQRQRVPPAAALAAPRVDLEVRKNLSDRTLPVNTTTEQHTWNLTARWDLALGGEAIARRSEADRRAEAAVAETERLAIGQRAELDALLPRLDNAERAVARLDTQIEQYASLVRAGEVQFEAGRRTLSQLISLHDSLYGAEQRRSDQALRLVQARLRRLSLSGVLLPALGLGPVPAPGLGPGLDGGAAVPSR